MAITANKLELVQIADAVAREKSIDRAIVIGAMEEAMGRAAKARYGQEHDIVVKIDPKTGETTTERRIHVVETAADIEDEATQITLEEARKRGYEGDAGGHIAQSLPAVEFGRITAQTAKQVIVQRVRDAERERQYEEYKDRVGEIVHGLVKRVEYGNVIVDLGRGEGVVRRDQGIPRENFHPGDRVRAYVMDVRREQRGPQIFLSRAHPLFMERLFAQEVPEVYEGTVEIKAVARDPGSRAKIGVMSKDPSIDPVGACVGMRGSRVQAVVSELQGEKIDIIQWSPDAATFIVNALAPAEVSKVVLDEDADRIEVVVPDEQLSLAIGRRGQNVRLASQLTGWDIDILTEEEESKRSQEELARRSKLFMDQLDVDEMLASLLAAEGFSSIEEIAFVDEDEVASIDGFDADTAAELQTRAREHVERETQKLEERRKELGVSDELLEFAEFSPAMLVALGEADVRTVEELAYCDVDELVGCWEVKNGERVREAGVLESFGLDRETAEELVLRARVEVGILTEEDYQALKAAELEGAEGDEDEAPIAPPVSAREAAEAVFSRGGDKG